MGNGTETRTLTTANASVCRACCSRPTEATSWKRRNNLPLTARFQLVEDTLNGVTTCGERRACGGRLGPIYKTSRTEKTVRDVCIQRRWCAKGETNVRSSTANQQGHRHQVDWQLQANWWCMTIKLARYRCWVNGPLRPTDHRTAVASTPHYMHRAYLPVALR